MFMSLFYHFPSLFALCGIALKTLNRQFQLASKNRTACSNNLVALLEQTFSGIRSIFTSPPRADGSLNAFTERYRKWCARHGYQFSSGKAAEIHAAAQSKIALVPKSGVSKLLIKEAVAQLNAVSRAVEVYRAEMNRLASQLPEYDTVMEICGVGPSMGPQLMAEIGDIRRFAHQRSLISFAGTDPERSDSGDVVMKHNRTSKTH